MTEHRASCQCGALRVTADADPDFVIACNCRACQRRTGSPFGATGYFRRESLAITGPDKAWARKADSGRGIENHFCPTCGTSLYWTLEMRPAHIGVAYGCFDAALPEPARAIWTEEQHAWVSFPEAWPHYPKGTPE